MTDFNPRSPRGERRTLPKSLVTATDFNPRSPRGERLSSCTFATSKGIFQSTLPARGATTISQSAGYSSGISIHAPREGSDPSRDSFREGDGYFNPRSPRGERPRTFSAIPGLRYFNPRSPRGERLSCDGMYIADLKISIHAPREGSDARRAPTPFAGIISIHAPREGSDPDHVTTKATQTTFQSTLPARGAT